MIWTQTEKQSVNVPQNLDAGSYNMDSAGILHLQPRRPVLCCSFGCQCLFRPVYLLIFPLPIRAEISGNGNVFTWVLDVVTFQVILISFHYSGCGSIEESLTFLVPHFDNLSNGMLLLIVVTPWNGWWGLKVKFWVWYLAHTYHPHIVVIVNTIV